VRLAPYPRLISDQTSTDFSIPVERFCLDSIVHRADAPAARPSSKYRRRTRSEPSLPSRDIHEATRSVSGARPSEERRRHKLGRRIRNVVKRHGRKVAAAVAVVGVVGCIGCIGWGLYSCLTAAQPAIAPIAKNAYTLLSMPEPLDDRWVPPLVQVRKYWREANRSWNERMWQARGLPDAETGQRVWELMREAFERFESYWEDPKSRREKYGQAGGTLHSVLARDPTYKKARALLADTCVGKRTLLQALTNDASRAWSAALGKTAGSQDTTLAALQEACPWTLRMYLQPYAPSRIPPACVDRYYPETPSIKAMKKTTPGVPLQFLHALGRQCDYPWWILPDYYWLIKLWGRMFPEPRWWADEKVEALGKFGKGWVVHSDIRYVIGREENLGQTRMRL